MKLNDPFGRLENRHQTGYEVMRDTMRKNRIDTPQAATEALRDIKKRALTYIVVVIAVLLPFIFLLPKAIPVLISLTLFLVVWVAVSAVNGQRYIRRYIDEDLNKRD